MLRSSTFSHSLICVFHFLQAQTISQQAQMIGNLTTSLQSVADAAATSDWVESNYLTQDAIASTYATQATVSANYPTTTQAIAMSDAVRDYAETLVEVTTESHTSFFPVCLNFKFSVQ